MLFLTLGMIFLLNGFDTGKKNWFYLAGLILGCLQKVMGLSKRWEEGE